MATTTSATKTLMAFMFVIVSPGLGHAKEWHGLVPMHSTCADVKRLLNVSECRTSYDTDVGQVNISFSTKPCVDGWNVPTGTVMDITVSPKVPPRVDELGLDLTGFQKTVSYDSSNYLFYTNKKDGITLSVTSDQKVYQIYYYATAEDEHLRYPNSLAPFPSDSGGDPQGTFKLDEYGDLASASEHKRLNEFVRGLPKRVEQIYIIVYAGRRATVGEALARAARVKDYLVRVSKIDPSRIFAVDGGYREQLTIELFGRSKGGSIPTATPRVCPSEVERIGRARANR